MPEVRPILRNIPVAKYTIGLCHFGHFEPYKTIEVKADSSQAALIEARKLLNPSTVESVRWVSTTPNEDHIAYQKELRIGYAAVDAAVAANRLKN